MLTASGGALTWASPSGGGGTVDLTTGVTGALPVANGGTGATTADAARNALLPSQTGNSGKFLVTNGTNTLWFSAGTVTGVNFSGGTTGLTANNSGIPSVPSFTLDGNLVAANGGTGLTTPGISGNVLTSNGTGGWVSAPVVATVTSDVYSNTAGGTSALATLTGGGYNGGANSAFGFSTLFANTTGSNNVALGAGSLQNNTTGSYSVAVGTGALSSSVAYGFNVALGYGTGSHVNGGYFNTLLGTTAGGQTLTSGNQNTLVGGYADVVAGTDNNSIVIGYNAVGQGSNTAVIGNSSVTTVGGYGSWTNFSDRREKENIQDLSLGLAFIQKLRPVSYNYISQPGVGREGLIAQEVEEAAQALGVTFHGVERPSTHNGRYSLSYPALVMPLINATKELKAENDALKAGNDALKAENEAQKTRLDALERQMAALLALVKPQQ